MSDVVGYYDQNTRGFLRFGQGGAAGVIRRAVWAPDVSDRDGAFRYIDDRLLEILDSVEREGPPRIVDLGCGIGSSLAYLAEHRQLFGTGVTISAVQVELARRRFAQSRLDERLRCIEADFADLPADLGPADLVYAIEAFVHGRSPASFFEQAARIVGPGGTLVVCDDFLTPTGARPDLPSADRRWLDDFRWGWHLSSLTTVDEADRLATAAGFVLAHDEDWTPWLELERVRDRLIAAAVRLGRGLPLASPWWQNLVGGNAGQKALLAGLVTYRFVVWRRTATPP